MRSALDLSICRPAGPQQHPRHNPPTAALHPTKSVGSTATSRMVPSHRPLHPRRFILATCSNLLQEGWNTRMACVGFKLLRSWCQHSPATIIAGHNTNRPAALLWVYLCLTHH